MSEPQPQPEYKKAQHHDVPVPIMIDRSYRFEWSLKGIAATVGAVVGYLTGNCLAGGYVEKKILPYDTEVAARTRADIVTRTRNGLAAGIAESGGLGAGFSEHGIREAHATELLKSDQFKFAKMIRIWGKSVFTIPAGIVSAVVLGGLAYLLAPKKENNAAEMEDLAMRKAEYAQQEAQRLKHPSAGAQNESHVPTESWEARINAAKQTQAAQEPASPKLA